jgi:hypothetical protein
VKNRLMQGADEDAGPVRFALRSPHEPIPDTRCLTAGSGETKRNGAHSPSIDAANSMLRFGERRDDRSALLVATHGYGEAN